MFWTQFDSTRYEFNLFQPFVAEPDNTRVVMPQEPQFYPNFPINNSVGSNTQGNGGFGGGGFGGGGAGSDF